MKRWKMKIEPRMKMNYSLQAYTYNGIISNSVFLLAYTLTIKEVKTVPNMSANNNPRTLTINLYTVGPPKVQPLDLTKLGDVPLQHSPQKDSARALIG